MPLGWTGLAGKVADGLNDVIIANQTLELELARVSEVVGRQGKLSQRVTAGSSTRGWSRSIDSVNDLIDSLVRPTVDMQRVVGAVAMGDLSKKVSAEVDGDMRELKNTINGMVDQLNGFISELTRVTREVGVEGKLGGQAQSEELRIQQEELRESNEDLGRQASQLAEQNIEAEAQKQLVEEKVGQLASSSKYKSEVIADMSHELHRP